MTYELWPIMTTKQTLEIYAPTHVHISYAPTAHIRNVAYRFLNAGSGPQRRTLIAPLKCHSFLTKLRLTRSLRLLPLRGERTEWGRQKETRKK